MRVGPPLDEPGGIELVDEANDGDRGKVENDGKLGLAGAFAALQPRHDRPLRAGRRHFSSALVSEGAQQPRDVMKSETEFAGKGRQTWD